MIQLGITWLGLFAGLAQDPAQKADSNGSAAPPAPSAPPVAATTPGEDSGWRVLNEVSLVVNEECTTAFDLHRAVRREAQRRGLDLKDPKVLSALYPRMLSEAATSMLQEQGGRALGFDPDLVDRITLREVERRRTLSQLQGLGMWAENPTEERDEVADYIYERLYDESVIGKSPGPAGRLSRDRYVRPGMLQFAYRARGKDTHPVGNALREQTEVQMTQLILDFERNAGREGAWTLAEELRERVLDGDEMGELAEEFGATAPGTRGLSEFVPILGLFGEHREVYDFLLTAEVGDVSEPLPFRQGGKEVAIVVIRLDELREPEFDDRATQQQMRSGVREWLDRQRRGRALEDLFNAAHVWPREALGTRSQNPVPRP